MTVTMNTRLFVVWDYDYGIILRFWDLGIVLSCMESYSSFITSIFKQSLANSPPPYPLPLSLSLSLSHPSNTNRLRALILSPHHQNTIGPTLHPPAANPKTLVAHGTPNPSYIFCAKSGNTAPNTHLTIVLAAIALLALILYTSTM